MQTLRVAIIGAGPAGTLCALSLLRRAHTHGRDIAVTLFDRKIFSSFGPSGCNMCAGVISHSLLRALEGLGLHVGPSLIQREIAGYVLETLGGALRLERPPDSRIYTAYRGMGPPGLEYDESRSFDLFLLRAAVSAGAIHVNRLVGDLRLSAGCGSPHRLELDNGGTAEADVVVAAFGVNSQLARRLEALRIGYTAPRLIRAAQAEIPLDPEFIAQQFAGEIRILNLGFPRVRFASLTPKRRHLTVSLVGEAAAGGGLEQFVAHPWVRASFPPGWELPAQYCHCAPRLPVTAAGRPRCDGLLAIGDADIARYLKDGIGSAFTTASLAARAILEAGTSAAALREAYYRPSRRRFLRDNLAGKLLFAANDILMQSPVAAGALMRVAAWEQGRLPAGARPLSEAFWLMFTGDGRYTAALRKGLRVRMLGRLLRALVRAAGRGRRASSPLGTG